MSQILEVLCVHGIGHQEADATWQSDWTRTLRDSLRAWRPDLEVAASFVAYDDLFEKAPFGPLDTAQALWKLLGSGIWHGVGDLFSRPRGPLGPIPDRVRWTAGMVIQWVENERLRTSARARVLQMIAERKPALVVAHSMGSLIAYDALIRAEVKAESCTFVSLGSQIGNAFVRGVFGGRLVPTRTQAWWHLFNRHDDVFTAPIRLADAGFHQVDTPFDIKGIADHDALQYLAHPATVNGPWRVVAGGPATRAVARGLQVFARGTPRPQRRALLVGINDYPRKEDRLEGCLNDVFLMSSVLQDAGFRAEEIRVVLDGRATAAGIRSRLHWLLEDVGDHDVRLFYYSGHGAQIPRYGENEEVDRLDECLVPHDFDWTPERAFTDDQFWSLYSQLPYKSRFVAIFDCCHSGGMTRHGGPRVRGIAPPDDIRHRSLRWDSEYQMWVPRDFERGRRAIGYTRNRPEYTGDCGACHRLGRSVPLRSLERTQYVAVRKKLGHEGPYLPVILQASAEHQFSYEYRHGVASYGAFTFALAEIFRGGLRRQQPLSVEALARRVGKRLEELEYDQTPQVVGPKALLSRPLPGLTRLRSGVPRRRKAPAPG